MRPRPPVTRSNSAALASAYDAADANPTSEPAIPTAPILVVDDDAKIVRLVRTYLERDGFMVVTASDGPGALDAIETHMPALVVLDLMLPSSTAGP